MQWYNGPRMKSRKDRDWLNCKTLKVEYVFKTYCILFFINTAHPSYQQESFYHFSHSKQENSNNGKIKCKIT